MGILIAAGSAGAALGLAQLAAAHGVVPASIQASPVKSGFLMVAEGLGTGLGLYFISPAAGLGVAAGLGGFGLYMVGEGLLNPPKPAASGTTPSSSGVQALGQTSPMDPQLTAVAGTPAAFPDATSTVDPSLFGDVPVGAVFDPRRVGAVFDPRRVGAIYSQNRIGALSTRRMMNRANGMARIGAIVWRGY